MKRYHIEMESSRTATSMQTKTLQSLGYQWEVYALRQDADGQVSGKTSYYAERATDALDAFNQVKNRISEDYWDAIRIIPRGGNVTKTYCELAPDVYHYNDGTRPRNNRGQYLEYCYRYSETGEMQKADNISAKQGADLNNVSVKSARASYNVDITEKNITNNVLSLAILQALTEDKADDFVYLSPENNKIAVYRMNKATFHEFLLMFGTLQRESSKNGGRIKIRLPRNDKDMIDWLECGGDTVKYVMNKVN